MCEGGVRGRERERGVKLEREVRGRSESGEREVRGRRERED